jgi:hypothetical protein
MALSEIELRTSEQRALFNALKAGGDVHIDTLFKAIGGPRHLSTTLKRQEYLGSYMTRLRRKLQPHGLTIRLGDLRHTYRLNVV